MLQPITLLGERQVFDTPRGRGRIPLEVIVGIEAGSETLRMRQGDWRYPGPHKVAPRRTQVALGEAAVDRLLDAYDSLFVQGDELDYDCHGLPMYMYGKIDWPRRGPFHGYGHNKGESCAPNALDTGRPYVVVNALGQAVHSMVALDGIHTMQFNGRTADGGGLLVKSTSHHMMTAYAGTCIRELTEDPGISFDLDQVA